MAEKSSMWPRRLRAANKILAEPLRYGSDVRRIAQWIVANAPRGTQEETGDYHDDSRWDKGYD